MIIEKGGNMDGNEQAVKTSVTEKKSVPGAAGSQPVNRPRAKKKKSGVKVTIYTIVAVIVISALGFLYYKRFSTGASIDSGRYQAVFLTNGQVYFGKLHAMNRDYLKLTDIYYIQTKSSSTDKNNPQETSSNTTNIELVKLGNEVHGPEDTMIINRDQVSFFENLKKDGQVAKTIESDKNKK